MVPIFIAKVENLKCLFSVLPLAVNSALRVLRPLLIVKIIICRHKLYIENSKSLQIRFPNERKK